MIRQNISLYSGKIIYICKGETDMANIIISPGKYIQGPGELQNISTHLTALGASFFVLSSSSGMKRFKNIIGDSFNKKGASVFFEEFNKECSENEINRLVADAKAADADVIIGVGGGKTLDTAKAVAYYAKLPVAIVPTIASTDAPCSALSVIYSDEGVFERYLFLPKNPDVVLVDTDVVAKAPARLLVAGMGDAMATYFEARACAASNATSCAGGQCAKAALALAKLCYDTLIADGVKALCAAERHVSTKAVENIIEANTYLSGIGFESAGLAAAHAIHNGLTAIPATHELYHGEKVAFGTIVQLVLEDAPMEELSEVLDSCAGVGLPTTLSDLGIGEDDMDKLRDVAELACADGDTMHNMPFPVDADKVFAAIIAADAIASSFRGDDDDDCDCHCH